MDTPDQAAVIQSLNRMPRLSQQAPGATPPPPPANPLPAPPPPAAGDSTPPAPPPQPSLDAPPPVPDTLLGVQPPPPPPPPPNQPPQPTPDQDYQAFDTSRWPEGQRRAFERIKAREAEYKKKADDALREAEALKTRIGQPDPQTQTKLAEYEAWKKRAEQAEQELAKNDIQRDPQFQAQFVQPRELKMGQVRSGLKAFGIDEKLADRLETLTVDQRLQEIAKALPADKQNFLGAIVGMIAPAMNDLDDIRVRREQTLAGAAQQRETWQAQKQQDIARFRQQHAETAMDALAHEGHFPFAQIDGNAQWNQFAGLMRTQVKQAIESQDPQLVTRRIAAGVAADYYLKMVKSLDTENRRLKADIAKLSQAAPRPGGGQPPPPPAGSQRQQQQGTEGIATASLRKALEAQGRPSPF